MYSNTCKVTYTEKKTTRLLQPKPDKLLPQTTETSNFGAPKSAIPEVKGCLKFTLIEKF